MSQSKLQSIKETLTSTGIGYVIAWFIVLACITYIPDPVAAATATTTLCTVSSLLRGYFVRRYFNRKAS